MKKDLMKMKRILLTGVLLCSSLGMYADLYMVKYEVRGTGSTSHCQTNLNGGTADEAKQALVRRGTISKENIDKVVIVEVKKVE